MSSPVLAASATRVVMATDEGHVGFDGADDDETAPRAFVWKTEPFLRFETEPFLRPHREQRVCAHTITMCGEHLYAYSLERRSHVCIHHVDATTPLTLAVGSLVECLAGAADLLVVGTKRGFVMCFELAAISAGSPDLDRLEILQIPSYRLDVSQQKITGLCFTPDTSGFFTMDAARRLRLWGCRPTAWLAQAAEYASGSTAGPTLELELERLLTEVGAPDWPSALAAITAVEPDFIVTSPDDLRAGAPRAPRLAPRNPRPPPAPLSPPSPRLPYSSQAAWRATKISSSQASAPPTSSSSIGGETAAQICCTCSSSLSASRSALRRGRNFTPRSCTSTAPRLTSR